MENNSAKFKTEYAFVRSGTRARYERSEKIFKKIIEKKLKHALTQSLKLYL